MAREPLPLALSEHDIHEYDMHSFGKSWKYRRCPFALETPCLGPECWAFTIDYSYSVRDEKFDTWGGRERFLEADKTGKWRRGWTSTTHDYHRPWWRLWRKTEIEGSAKHTYRASVYEYTAYCARMRDEGNW